jgi:hypothetical protein
VELQAALVAIALYLLPAIVAAARKHPSGWAIFILNLLLGWTVLGWIIALIWSATGERGAGQQAIAMQARRTCPYCAEPILAAAIKCKHCGEALEPEAAPSAGAAGYQAARKAAKLLRRG